MLAVSFRLDDMRRWRTTKHEDAVLPTGAKTICISTAAPGWSADACSV